MSERLDTQPDEAKRGAKARLPMTLWSRLSAADFMNSSMVFAALAILCLFPFMMIIGALLGRDIMQAWVHRLGFSQEATNDVLDLFAKGDAPLSTLTWTSIPFLAFSAYAIASTLQAWYGKVFAHPPAGWKPLILGNLAWVVAMLTYLSLSLGAGKLFESAGGIVVGSVQFTLAILFWWTGAYVLFFGALSMARALPDRACDHAVLCRARGVRGGGLLVGHRDVRKELRRGRHCDGHSLVLDRPRSCRALGRRRRADVQRAWSRDFFGIERHASRTRSFTAYAMINASGKKNRLRTK